MRGSAMGVLGLTWVTPCCPWPVAILGTAVIILAGVPVPEVMTLVVMMVMGDLMPGVLLTPAGMGSVWVSAQGLPSAPITSNLQSSSPYLWRQPV